MVWQQWLGSNSCEFTHVKGGTVEDLGLVTTPQLHFAVRRKNRNLPGGEEAYYDVLSRAFKAAIQGFYLQDLVTVVQVAMVSLRS